MFVRIYAAAGRSIPQSFEGFIQAVSPWDGMYAEWDGSWVWVFHEGQTRFQLDGMLYDQAGTIEYVEVKGQANRAAWERLCSLLIGDDQILTAEELGQHLRVHDIEHQCWRSPCDPKLLES